MDYDDPFAKCRANAENLQVFNIVEVLHIHSIIFKNFGNDLALDIRVNFRTVKVIEFVRLDIGHLITLLELNLRVKLKRFITLAKVADSSIVDIRKATALHSLP